MSLNIEHEIKLLIKEAKDFINGTDITYSYIAEKFPILLMEIDNNLKNVKSMADNLLNNENKKELNSIQEILQTIEEAKIYMSNLQDRDSLILQNLGISINKLKDFEKNLSKIKTDSVEMELISINAMTVALKAGGHGRAFSYITEELKQLSTKTITITDSITKKGMDILNEFHYLQSLLSDLKNDQNKTFIDFQTKLNESFDGINKGIKDISKNINELTSKADDIKPLLFNIMQETQNQDIIRQSMDHVIIALESIKNVTLDSIDYTEEDILVFLEEMSFLRSLPDLCDGVLENIKEITLKGCNIFNENSFLVEKAISDIENKREIFTVNMLNRNETSSKSINTIFKTSFDILKNLINNLNDLNKRKELTINNTEFLVKDMQSFDHSFKVFSRLITRFHSIDVASRIEVAKQEVLQKMSGTVNQMTNLTKRIEEDINDTINIISRFIDQGKIIVDDYFILHNKEKIFVEQFSKNIQNNYQNLSMYKNSIIEEVSNLNIFSDEFKEIFLNTKTYLTELEKSVSHLDRVIEIISAIRYVAEDVIKNTIKKYDVKDWQPKNAKLKTITDKFTIFTHKKIASDAGGFDINQDDSEVDSGEITLF